MDVVGLAQSRSSIYAVKSSKDSTSGNGTLGHTSDNLSITPRDGRSVTENCSLVGIGAWCDDQTNVRETS